MSDEKNLSMKKSVEESIFHIIIYIHVRIKRKTKNERDRERERGGEGERRTRMIKFLLIKYFGTSDEPFDKCDICAGFPLCAIDPRILNIALARGISRI